MKHLKKYITLEVKAQYENIRINASEAHDHMIQGNEDHPSFSWYIKTFLTKKQIKQVPADPYKAKSFFMKCLKEVELKAIAEKTKKIDQINQAPDFAGGILHIEWKKSKMYSYNPTAEAIIYASDGSRVKYTGTASGCGYDKKSAAVADALNKSEVITKALYMAAEARLKKGVKVDKYGTGEEPIKADSLGRYSHVLGYGSGYSVLPYFEGGVGVDCYYSYIPGYEFKSIISGEKYDVYQFVKK